ncbi:redoxin domain-containing protein [Halobacillus karajensis]|uniref:Thiol-disulfide oxidoreductase ResA n=1 Tax=Halobacillus karajensis TaxID=195088 RepID=A0A024P535_9BACI|nr:redoxin domain-containing protein [Halobacillus karajensis]CDQ20637.1 Thiol-disulfide oxidoreductase ResA [Halobacillus karajensis]CDQ23893.1 Thiol-disulfide oxidoreductase ResA [Halobacillus karajensis]CDQ27371.1 Thiol-disulfide oxidoreductase ResA [Halobacillus karajensis]
MKKWGIILIMAVLFGWAAYDFVSKEKGQIQEQVTENGEMVAENSATEKAAVGLEKGQQAPDFTLQTLSGEETSLSDYRGKKVMINFWATWCPPCRAEMPDMQKFSEKEDIQILAVNLTETESSVKGVQDFADEFGLTFPILLDKDDSVANKYEINPVPTSIFVNEEGKISSVMLGVMNYDRMVQRLEEM